MSQDIGSFPGGSAGVAYQRSMLSGSVCDLWHSKGDLDRPFSGKIFPNRKYSSVRENRLLSIFLNQTYIGPAPCPHPPLRT
jgi:hypothetical protein